MGFTEISEVRGEFTRDQYIGGLAKKEGVVFLRGFVLAST